MKTREIFIVLLSFLISGCNAPQKTQPVILVKILVDGQSSVYQIPQGGDVEVALASAKISLGNLDRVEPSLDTVLRDGSELKVIRVTEKFLVEQETIPFEQQVLQTDSLPQETKLIAQRGENGIKEITYRQIFENGIEVSKTKVNDGLVIKDAIPEIMMIGIQTPFVTYPIPGRLAYILNGNAWLMEGNTGNRRPIVATGDLDGRIFTLSPDGNWLLFTRKDDNKNQINNLWVEKIGTDVDSDKLIDLKVANIVHYADWVPGSTSLEISFSTVEVRSTAPGWQANNDFNTLSFSNSGWISKWKTYLDANSGGVYGWWGTNFTWGIKASLPAYSRPDAIGLLNLEDGTLETLIDITPYQTHSDWAWIPGISWAPNGSILYGVVHASQVGIVADEESQNFDVVAKSLLQNSSIRLVSQAGMFAYPVVSIEQEAKESVGYYQVAFLQAIFPTQSETSRYRLNIMDQDGSNIHSLFPGEEKPGLEPQKVVWSPDVMPDTGNFAIAVVYNGNLYIVDASRKEGNQSEIRQITGDGLVSRISWAIK